MNNAGYKLNLEITPFMSSLYLYYNLGCFSADLTYS